MKIIRTDRSSVFTIKYKSTCKICTKEIKPGDRARYLNGNLRHETCPRDIRVEDHLYMQKPKKKPNSSFLAKYRGTCPRCFEEIEVGERIRYSPEGELVHHRHSQREKKEEICGSCWLVKPCECE